MDLRVGGGIEHLTVLIIGVVAQRPFSYYRAAVERGCRPNHQYILHLLVRMVGKRREPWNLFLGKNAPKFEIHYIYRREYTIRLKEAPPILSDCIASTSSTSLSGWLEKGGNLGTPFEASHICRL